MINEWRDTLLADQAGPLTRKESAAQLETYADATRVQLSALSSYAIVEVRGADAQSFLQGQFCNDLAQVLSTQAQITGYCTPKGRLLALPTLVGFDEGYRLLVPGDVAEAFIKRLSMFVMRADVTIRVLDDWAALGITVAADGASDELISLVGELPAAELSVSSGDDAQVIRWHDDHTADKPRARYLRLATVERQQALWTTMGDAAKSSDNTWRLGDISAGIPSITQGVIDAFVPQMINLQLINALSFKKGCYPGQEIVARMQYLGKLKRHMRVFTMALDGISTDVDAALQAGSALVSGADENAGIVVDAMPLDAGTALVLAVTKVTSSDDAFTLTGAALTPRAMPYELPATEVAVQE